VTKQRYIHFSLNDVLYLLFHVHNRVENVSKHVLFNIDNINVMAKKIGLPIRKLLENNLLYEIMGQTKTRKLLLTRLKIKHNIIVLRHHVI